MNKSLYIGLFFISLLFSTLISSCSVYEDVKPQEPADGETGITLQLSSMTRGDSSDDKEIIETLRIILTDNDGRIAANNFIRVYDPTDLSATPVLAKDYSYTWNFACTPGDYNLFVVANETSINDFDVENYTFISKPATLKEFLDGFMTGRTGFEDIVKDLYFKPDYTKSIPLSCEYELSVARGETRTIDVYLVNVATKFQFNFSNYRNEEVTFSDITINNVSDSNYLLAKVEEEEKFINGDYWIDWLKKVVDETNRYPDFTDDQNSNDLVNQKWGWLTKYKMPVNSNHENGHFLGESETWTIESSTPQTGSLPLPGKAEKGPFYFPESKYSANGNTQSYSLTFVIQFSDKDPKVITKNISYIKTLFRNTYAIIDVEMTSAVEDIYVEIYPWVEKDPVYDTVAPE